MPHTFLKLQKEEQHMDKKKKKKRKTKKATTEAVNDRTYLGPYLM